MDCIGTSVACAKGQRCPMMFMLVTIYGCLWYGLGVLVGMEIVPINVACACTFTLGAGSFWVVRTVRR